MFFLNYIYKGFSKLEVIQVYIVFNELEVHSYLLRLSYKVIVI